MQFTVAELPNGPFRLTSVDCVKNPQVSDAGLAHFKDCDRLVYLGLSDTKVTGAVFAHFKNCAGLVELHLQSTGVRDDDLVHFDFHHRNALQDVDGRLTAVVDWEGVRQGDSAFDLVTLAFGLAIADCTEALIEQTWHEAIAATSRGCLRAYVAHMALRHLDWKIRFHPDDVDRWVTVCHESIQRCPTR